MNWQSFGPIGYLGLVLAAGAVAAWLIFWKKPQRWLARMGLGLALAAYLAARVNSSSHVNRIAVDPAEQLAKVEASQEARRQAALESRGDEVAAIRFAEDSQNEFLDKAGMDEADRKYLEGITDQDTPEWKKQKKERGTGSADDDDLESMIDGEEKKGGADVEQFEKNEGPAPILMSEGDVVTANRLDRVNLRGSEVLIGLALLLVGYDYLRRVNRYAEASFPVPLPSRLPNAITPLPVVVARPKRPRRSVDDELLWLAQRGEYFIYLGDSATRVGELVAKLNGRIARGRRMEVLEVGDSRKDLDDDFVFEALWYGRSCFAVGSSQRANQILERFVTLLKQRGATAARTRQTVHVVWDLAKPIPESTKAPLVVLARPAGFSLFLTEPNSSPS